MTVIDELRSLAPPQSHRAMSHPDQLWRASMLGYCPRRQILAAKGINLQNPDWLLRKFSLHNGSHSQVENWLVECLSDRYEILLEHQVYDPETRAGGTMDAVIVDDQIAHVVEIKTYVTIPRGGPKEDSYWQNQISFYYHTVADQQNWLFVEPVVLIATFEGQIRVVKPAVTETFKEILARLNLCWEADMLPEYVECYGNHDCKKCQLQSVCTEPIDTITEFAEVVKMRSMNG